MKWIKINFSQIRIRNHVHLSRSPYDLRRSFRPNQRTENESQLTTELITKINEKIETKRQLKLDKRHRRGERPGEANIEGIIDEHLTRGLGLSLAFLSQNGEIRAALDPSFFIPRALPVTHKNYSLCCFDWRKRCRGVELGAQ